MFVRAQNAGPASGLELTMREPSVVSCVPLAPRITCSLLTVIATKHSFDFGNREWLVATRERGQSTIGPHKTTGFTQLSSDEPIKPTENFLREAGPARGLG